MIVETYHLTIKIKKSSLIQNLEVVGVFSSVGISSQNLELELVDCNISESDSDSEFGKPMSDIEDDDHHLNDYQKYGQPSHATFAKDLMVTDTNVICWLPLGTIWKKKNEMERSKTVYKMQMAKGVVDTAVPYTKKTIIQNQLFQHCTKLDPNFCISFRFYYRTIRKWLGKA